MRKFIILFLSLFFMATAVYAEKLDYVQTYRDMPVPTFNYVNEFDPGQYYDCMRYTSVPYPLFRLSSPIYFKNITIPEGYYYLTPRTYKGDEYILVKQQGIVKYILPTYKKDFVPLGYYEAVLPRPKLSPWQKFQEKMYNAIGRISKRSRRLKQPDFYLELSEDRKSTRLNSSHQIISYAVFCL